MMAHGRRHFASKVKTVFELRLNTNSPKMKYKALSLESNCLGEKSEMARFCFPKVMLSSWGGQEARGLAPAVSSR